MESTSLVNMVSQGHSTEYQTDSLVHNIQTLTVPRHFFIESSKCVNHNNLILISTSDSGEMSQQAPYTVLHNKIPKLITSAPRHPYLHRQPKPTTTKRYLVPIPKLSTISSTEQPVIGNCNELKTLKLGFINIRSLSTKV